MAGYYFRLPTITQLTKPQQSALYETEQIALSGGPGTGKSVVSLWRHIRNYQSVPVKRSLLLTYTTTLKAYLAACCKTIRDEEHPDAGNNSSRNVGTSLKNSDRVHHNIFTELIIDEAQDLPREYYSGIPSPLSYGADDSQILYPDHCSTQDELQGFFPNNVKYELDKNFRSTQRIMLFCKQAFPYANIPRSIIDGLSNNPGEKPVLLVSYGNKYDVTNEKQNNAIERIINSFRAADHNISILVPWKKDAQIFEMVLKNKNIEYSIYYEDAKRFPLGCGEISNVHITTFKSAKGLEFDTVIVPNFNIIRRTPIRVNKEETMDRTYLDKLKRTINRLDYLQKDHDIILSETTRPDDGQISVLYSKLMCSWEDVYVACTRARSNLYLISNFDLSELNTVTEKEIL